MQGLGRNELALIDFSKAIYIDPQNDNSYNYRGRYISNII